MRRLLSRGFLLLTALIVGASAVRLLGQPQSDQKPPGFEVASIKPNSGGPESGMRQFRGGRYITRYATLKDLISHAYGVRGRSLSDRQVVSAPTWLGVDRIESRITPDHHHHWQIDRREDVHVHQAEREDAHNQHQQSHDRDR